MINNKMIIGFIIGIAITLLGIILYTFYIGTQVTLSGEEIKEKLLISSTYIKYTYIGVILNLPIFYFFIVKKKENLAKGFLAAIVVMAMIYIVNKF